MKPPWRASSRDAHTHFPADVGSLAVLVFSYHGRADVDVAHYYTGCPSGANGRIVATPGDALRALALPVSTGSSPSP